MANVSVDQILEQIANALMDDAGGQQTLGNANYSGGGNFLNQVVRPRIETLLSTQATIDATVSKAFSKFNMSDDLVENVLQKVKNSKSEN